MPLDVLEELLAPAPAQKHRDAARVPAFLEIGYGYQPGRSSAFSAVCHVVAVLLIAFSSTRMAYVHAVEVVHPRLEPMRVDPLYLPVLGGGSEGDGAAGGGSGTPVEASSWLRARSHRGFAYPGPQPLVSAPPMAKLGIQTILRPNLENPPILHQNFPLPNLAIAAPPPSPEPPNPVMKVENGRLAIRPVEKPVAAPKLKLPTASTSSLPQLALAEPVMPQAPPPKPIPAPARTSDVPVSSRERQGLLVLNAVPPPPDVVARVPLGEARSLFAVAPGQSTVIAEPSAGTSSGGSSSKASGNGTPSDNPTGDAIADLASGGGAEPGGRASGRGSGSNYGSGRGSGVNPVSIGSSTGRGSASGAGTGGGTTTALGSGGGAGNSPGGGGFPGISIRGGSYGNGSPGIHTNTIPRSQTSYSMTITSTASSGGGLPDYGVFQNEKVYTVYLDMRSSDDDAVPSWTLQYALLQPTDPSAIRIIGVPAPPYATLKQVPELTPDLAATCAKKLIVASGILSTNGRLEQISVKKTPDPRVNTLVTDALANWLFQPSQIQGNPVAVKIVLGIRLAPK
jgi:hypothetical protein